LKNYGDTNFITGMRAYAALAVLLIHAGGGGLREFGGMGDKIANLGLAGVYVFFVISGYSVASSYLTSEGFWHYINKRIWRLLPLYYFWLLLAILTGAYLENEWGKDIELDAYNVALHLFFVGFLDHKITNSILGVEWSISIEMFWYFLVPCLLLIVPAKNKPITAVVILSCILYFLTSKLFGHFKSENTSILAFLWSPVPYVVSYCFGVAAFRLRELSPNLRQYGNTAFVILLLLLFVYLLRPSRSHHVLFLFFSALTFALLVFGTSASTLFRWTFENKPVIWLGTISYGIYLCHLPVLAWLPLDPSGNSSIRFVVTAAAATALSSLAYYIIERPGMTLGAMIYRHSSRPP
jgi:peptidoglycan/LPS O-acetylase OafA/YrhL